MKFPTKGIALGAAYSGASTFKESFAVSKEQTMDVSSSSFYHLLYTLQLKRATPTKRIVHVWRKLYQSAKKQSNSKSQYPHFKQYFDTYGTHYYQSGDVGGEWNMRYTVDQVNDTKENSTSRKRADCLSLKITGAYFDRISPLSIDGKVCADQFEKHKAGASFESIVQSSWSSCNGAAHVCPYGPGYDDDPKEALKKWIEAIPDQPVLLKGRKSWIITLLRHVITFADFDEDLVYRSLLTQFGGNASYDSSLKQFEEFLDMMTTQLETYVRKHQYCRLYPTDPYCGDCVNVCKSHLATKFNVKTQTCQCAMHPEDVFSCKWNYGWFWNSCEPKEKCEVHSYACGSYYYRFKRYSQTCDICRPKRYDDISFDAE